MSRPYVGFYLDGHWLADVRFKTKWQAWLFHVMLNRSVNATGVRYY